MKKIEVTCGFKFVDEHNNIVGYDGGNTFNGYCYKDEDAFKSGEGICYISEYELEDLKEDIDNLDSLYNIGELSKEEYEGELSELLCNCGWTRKDFISLVGGKDFIKVAEHIFYSVDWQCPITYFTEFLGEFQEDYDFEIFGITKEQANSVWDLDLA